MRLGCDGIQRRLLLQETWAEWIDLLDEACLGGDGFFVIDAMEISRSMSANVVDLDPEVPDVCEAARVVLTEVRALNAVWDANGGGEEHPHHRSATELDNHWRVWAVGCVNGRLLDLTGRPFVCSGINVRRRPSVALCGVQA